MKKKTTKKKAVKKTAEKAVKKPAKKVAKKAVKKPVKKVAKKAAKKVKKKPGKNENLVKFQIEAEGRNEIYVAGSFNNWDPKANRLLKSKDKYTTSIILPKGRYEYKFVINGIWCVDPNCDDWQPNSMGTINSIITVE